MASVMVPVPENGVPCRIKAVISSKDRKQKEERFIFIGAQNGSKGERTFSLKSGALVAEIGLISPEKETISVSLVYPSGEQKSPGSRDKSRFIQKKVELTVASQK